MEIQIWNIKIFAVSLKNEAFVNLWRLLCKSVCSLFRYWASLTLLCLSESRNAKWTLGLGSPSCVSKERRRFLLSDRSNSLLDPSVPGFKYLKEEKCFSDILITDIKVFQSFYLADINLNFRSIAKPELQHQQATGGNKNSGNLRT